MASKLTLKRCFLLQLILLNEATLVLVNDSEGLLEVIGGLASQADLCEEVLVVERVSSCVETEKGALGRVMVASDALVCVWWIHQLLFIKSAAVTCTAAGSN